LTCAFCISPSPSLVILLRDAATDKEARNTFPLPKIIFDPSLILSLHFALLGLRLDEDAKRLKKELLLLLMQPKPLRNFIRQLTHLSEDGPLEPLGPSEQTRLL
jgi:hypothetical protein